MTLPAVLPSVAELLDGARSYSIPLRHSFRGLSSREGMLLHGPSGWGEFAPFEDYSDTATARWLAAAIEAAWGSWPAPIRTTVPVNAIVPAVPPADARELVRASACTSVKVKVAQTGQSLGDDVERVAAVRDELGLGGLIRIDANGGWSIAEAEAALVELSVFGLEYVEQPCATLDEMRRLHLSVDLPLAVDEGIRRAPDPEHVTGLRDAADIIVLKVAPLGGVSAARKVADQYRLPVVVSSALESSIGLSAGLALAASLPVLPYACGLGSGRLFASDVVQHPQLPRAGVIEVSRLPVDEDAIGAVSGAPQLLEHWRSRLTAAYRMLPTVYGLPEVVPAGDRQ